MDGRSHLHPEAQGEKMGRVDLQSKQWDESAMEDKRLLNYMAPVYTEMSGDIGIVQGLYRDYGERQS